MQSYFGGKTVWVVGASSGIGRALALRAAELGARVIVSARNTAALEELRASRPSSIEILPLDVQGEAARARAVEEIRSRFGAIDLLIYSAGLSQRATAVETALATVRTVMEVNFFAAVHLSTLLLSAGLIRKGGRIVPLSSVTGYVATPKRSSYAASKHALQGYFNALRAELHGSGVGVTVICPGFVDTGIDARSLLGDGRPQGRPDLDRAHGISAEECAERTLKAVAAGRPEVYIGKEKLAIYLQRFFPGFVYRFAHRFSPKTDE